MAPGAPVEAKLECEATCLYLPRSESEERLLGRGEGIIP